MACIAVWYFESIGRHVLVVKSSPKWVKTIYKHLQNLKDQKNFTSIIVALPKLNKTAASTIWSGSTIAFLNGHNGVCNAPMSSLNQEKEVNKASDYVTLLLTNCPQQNFPVLTLNLSLNDPRLKYCNCSTLTRI